MTNTLTIGFPRMRAEHAERRDFLPSFTARLIKLGASVLLEHGYGAGMGFSEEDYQRNAPGVQFVPRDEAYSQPIVMILRCPAEEDLRRLQPGACLISMLHYPTRPDRVEFLRSLGIEGISLDSLTDDVGRRLIENLRSVAWNGLGVGFQVLQRTYPAPGLEDMQRPPIRATVLGVGAVGVHAVQAASRYGNVQLWHRLAGRGVPGVQVTAIEYDLTSQVETMREILSTTDILVDATQRPDPSKVVIPNKWIGWMPEHAVLVDLSVDPYNFNIHPPEVKGIEGIPQGNLDQYVFLPNDPAYEQVPEWVSKENRRHVVSCYSWPGIQPKACMELYGKQLSPVMRALLEKGGVEYINPKGRYFERAMGRAMLSRWQSSEKPTVGIKDEKEK